jgi:AMIN domain
MDRLQLLVRCGLLVAVLAGGCSTKRAGVDELGATDAPLPDSLAAYSSPLDLREFDVAETEGGQRGVFLKLSRLPSGVTASSQSDPPRIIVDIQGPTGTESAEEVFPAGDTLVTHVGVSRTPGWLRVVLDLQGSGTPEFAVYPMADWVVVRIKSPITPPPHPWAHRAS